VQKKQLFQRQEAVLAFLGGQGHEAGDLLGDRQQRLQLAVVAFPFQLQRQRKAGVGDERERMRRVDGQRRQHRKDVVQEMGFQMLQVARRQLAALEDRDALGLHLFPQAVEGGLLRLHQAARVGVDKLQLLGRAAAILGQGGVAVPDQRAQAGDADGVELVKVGGRNRQEAQPFQKRHGGVRRLFQDAPVEGQPGKLAVEIAPGAGGFRKGKLGRAWEGGIEEIGMGHGRGYALRSVTGK
jgi:hypothetical protein